MRGASWRTVGDNILMLVTREPPFVQILFVLGIAFGVLMILEGLRANLRPSRKAAMADAGRDATSGRASPTTAFSEPRSWSVRRSALTQATVQNAPPAFRKIRTASKKPGRFLRPQIRRTPLQSFDAHEIGPDHADLVADDAARLP